MSKVKRPGIGVGVMILKENKILLGKRNNDPLKADSLLHGEGTWTMPGGKVGFKEPLHTAAIREVIEETNIKAKNLELMSINNDVTHDNHFITVGFLCREFEGEPITKEPDEITEWKWFSLTKLPEKIFPPSKKMIENYIKKTIYVEGDDHAND